MDTSGREFAFQCPCINVAEEFKRRPIDTGNTFRNREDMIARLDVRRDSRAAEHENCNATRIRMLASLIVQVVVQQ